MRVSSALDIMLGRTDKQTFQAFKVLVKSIEDLQSRQDTSDVLNEIQKEFASSVSKVVEDIEKFKKDQNEALKIGLSQLESNITQYIDNKVNSLNREETDLSGVKKSIQKINGRLLSVSKFMKKHGS